MNGNKAKAWIMLRNVLIVSGVGIFILLASLGAYHFYAQNRYNNIKAGLLVAGVIVDEESGRSIRADVFLDGRIWARDVDRFEIFIWPGQSREIAVRAPGYKTWSLVFTIPPVYSKREVFTGPVRLKKERS